jgi:hypothetical protein
MVSLEWNALRVGDKVLVHDPGDPAMQLLPGVVAMVQTKEGSNDIGVRVAPRRDRPASIGRAASPFTSILGTPPRTAGDATPSPRGVGVTPS